MVKNITLWSLIKYNKHDEKLKQYFPLLNTNRTEHKVIKIRERNPFKNLINHINRKYKSTSKIRANYWTNVTMTTDIFVF